MSDSADMTSEEKRKVLGLFSPWKKKLRGWMGTIAPVKCRKE